MTTTISIIFLLTGVIAFVIAYRNHNKSKDRIQQAKDLLKSAEFSLNVASEKNQESKSLINNYYKSKNELQTKHDINKDFLKFYMNYSDLLENEINQKIEKSREHVSAFISLCQKKHENELSKSEVSYVIMLIIDHFKSHVSFDKRKISLLQHQIEFSKRRIENKDILNIDVDKEVNLIKACNDLMESMQKTNNAIEDKINKISSYSDKDTNTEVLINLLIDIMEMRMNAFPEENQSSKVGTYKISQQDKEDVEKTKNDFLKTLKNDNDLLVNSSKTKNNLERFIVTLNSLINNNCDDDNKWIEALDLIPDVMNEEECKIWGIYYKGVLASKTYKNFNSENYQNLSNKEKWVFNSIMKIENSLKNNLHG